MDGLTWISAARSDTGLKRKVNEDAVFNVDGTPLWCVADGMGGHSRGDVASQLVTFTVSKVDPNQSLPEIIDDVDEGLQSAHRLLIERSSSDGSIIGSTVVAAAAVQRVLAVIWAGDSRAYLFRDGVCHVLTRDHTQLEGLIDRGEVRPEDIIGHPSGRVVTRAVGAGHELALDVEVIEAAPGDKVLLCSDGLGKHIDDDELADYFAEGALPGPIADRLLDTVIKRGATDNVSLVVLVAQPGP